jgi:hypothetical protein
MSKEKQFNLEAAKQIGEALGIDWNKFDIEQFRRGARSGARARPERFGHQRNQ